MVGAVQPFALEVFHADRACSRRRRGCASPARWCWICSSSGWRSCTSSSRSRVPTRTPFLVVIGVNLMPTVSSVAIRQSLGSASLLPSDADAKPRDFERRACRIDNRRPQVAIAERGPRDERVRCAASRRSRDGSGCVRAAPSRGRAGGIRSSRASRSTPACARRATMRSPVRSASWFQSESCGQTRIIALCAVQPPSVPARGYSTPSTGLPSHVSR